MAMMDHSNIVRLYGKFMVPSSLLPPHPPLLSLSLFLSLSLNLSLHLSHSGICVSNPILLVMEIAHLGPLNKFLRRHP